MEKLKLGINIVIALSLVGIAVALMTMATEYATKKSWSYGSDTYIRGDFSTYEECIKNELFYYKVKLDREIEPYGTSCEYR